MIILHVTPGTTPNEIIIRAMMSDAEFKRLLGHLEDLCVFAKNTITQPTRAIRTGARHNKAKYLLFPASLRKAFSADDFDFDRIRCGAMEHGDALCIIFTVPKQQALPPASQDASGKP